MSEPVQISFPFMTTKPNLVYLIGSLRNPNIPKIANQLEEAGFEIFDDWYAAGPEADDKWRDYEKERGRDYLTALNGAAATNVFNFDKRHLTEASAVILAAPAGKSGHLELGWALGQGKKGYYLLDSPDRWDVMLKFCTLVTDKIEDIIKDLNATSVEQAQDSIEVDPIDSGIRWPPKYVGKPLYSGEGWLAGGSPTKVSGVAAGDAQTKEQIHLKR